MNVLPFDEARHRSGIMRMLEGKEHLAERFKRAAASAKDSVYVAEDSGEAVGLLMVQEFDRRRVTPTVFVDEGHRRRGIGTELLRFLDRMLDGSPYEYAERQTDADAGTAAFQEKNGYSRCFTEIMMERDATPVAPESTNGAALAQRGIVIRNYGDEDYWAYHNIVGVGFYLMREKIGMPRWYGPPSEYERKELAEGCGNRYVMLEKGEVIAVSKINGSDISLLGVRPDKQSQGYGTLLLSHWIDRIILERQAQKITIDTTDGNPAIRLYKRMGFREIGRRYDYIKFNKPDSRPKAPKGYANEDEIMEAFRLHGMLREEMTP